MNDAGTAYIGVEPDLKGFGSNLGRGIDPHIDKTSSHITSKLGGAFKAVAGIAGGIFVGTKLFELGGDLLKLGTQVDTFGKKSQTVFQESNADVTKWAKTNASAFGLTDDSLRGLAANFGDLLKPMGFTSAEAAKMSTEVVGLSGALSAWSGGTRTAAEVSNILAKAMLGERDGLKELGISISEADVQGRLATKGQKELTGAALEQAKALATQELIFEKSADAQKAWADGSLDAVKKQNALKEKIAELKEDLAAKLQPAFASAVGFIVDKVIPGFERLGRVVGPIMKEVVKDLGQGLGGFKSAFSGEGVTSDGFVGVMERIGVSVRSVVEWVKNNWPSIQATIAGVVEWIRTDVVPKVQEVARFFIEQFAKVIEWVKANWPAISEAVGHVIATVRELFEKLAPVIRVIWETIKTNVETQIDLVLGIIRVVLDIINGDWRRVWDGIKDFFAGIWDSIFQTARDGVAKVVDVFLGMVGHIIHAADSAFGWIPGIGDKLHDARVAFDNFRDGVNASIRGIDAEKTITINVVEAVSRENNSNLGTAGDPIAPPAGSEDNSTEALPDRAHGLTDGPLPGPLGKPLLLRAHGGEWVLTPEQYDALRSGRSGGSMPAPVPSGDGGGHGHDIVLDGVKVGRAVAPGVSQAQFEGRRR